jgi:NADPH-dependent 2,4-dienoyl-CoA reductase/sulfur reductase-like enzyme
MPYNRPPLSKGDPGGDVSALMFRIPRGCDDVDWRLGVRAVRAELKASTVHLHNGSELEYDGLICATGLEPRRVDDRHRPRWHVLRTHDDAQRLFRDVEHHRSMLVLGAGFLGCEAAAAARAIGADVEVLAPEPAPMLRPLGTRVGDALRRRLEAGGVRFALSESISSIQQHQEPIIVTGTGRELSRAVVLQAIGSVPHVEWLDGNELDLSDGVLCDESLCVCGTQNVFACGDVARWPNALIDDIPRRVEHWTVAAESGRAAGKNLAAHLAGRHAEAFRPVPFFWSDQFDFRIQSFGWPELAQGDPRLLEGDFDDEFVVGYYREAELIAVVLGGLPGKTAAYRTHLTQALAAPA